MKDWKKNRFKRYFFKFSAENSAMICGGRIIPYTRQNFCAQCNTTRRKYSPQKRKTSGQKILSQRFFNLVKKNAALLLGWAVDFL